MTPSPIQVFFSYSHRDEELLEELRTQLALLKRQGIIQAWHDREISAGTEYAKQIDKNLNSAHIILLLVSANFLASDYCYDIEMNRAMERHEAGEARVIPIILRPCDWTRAPFRKLQALPKNAKPVTTWQNRDEAFLDIARAVRQVAEQMGNKTLPAEEIYPQTLVKDNSPSQGQTLTDRQRRRLEQRREDLEKQYNLINTKLSRLRQAYAVEVDVADKIKLEAQIQETDTQLQQVEGELDGIEQQLG